MGLSTDRDLKAADVAGLAPRDFGHPGTGEPGGWRERYRSIGSGQPVMVDGRRMRYLHGPAVDASDVLPDGRKFANIDEYKQLLLAEGARAELVLPPRGQARRRVPAALR